MSDTATTRFMGLEWPANLKPQEKKSLLAGGLGWMLDAMDVTLYSLVLATLLAHFGMSKSEAGTLNSLTLLASAIGGFLFGFIADKVGRTRALMGSILVYSLASFACGFAQDITQLKVFRFILGLGMGGEWTTGAALIAETWPAAHRGKALGLMQSTWAIGEMIAAGVTLLVLPNFGWRAVFFVGVLPALMVLWIRRDVHEPALWTDRQGASSTPLSRLLTPEVRKRGILATLMNAFGMFGYWGLFTWIPGYLALPERQGGRGLSVATSLTWVLFMAPGKWLGYTLFGFAADSLGRKRSYVFYLVMAAVLVPIFGRTTNLTWLYVLGPFVGFFGTGFFSGFAPLTSELFPTEIRATAMGITYNIGRGFSAAAPFVVGAVATKYSFEAAFLVLAASFFMGAVLALTLPETKGKALD